MNDHSVKHATFVIKRSYNADLSRVFGAFADAAIKRRWFIEGDGWVIAEFSSNFTEGGRERSSFRYGDGPLMSNDTLYREILPQKRIVLTYTMTIGGKRVSDSLATIEFCPDGPLTHLTYTEQAAFFDGTDRPADREAGFNELFDALDAELLHQAELH